MLPTCELKAPKTVNALVAQKPAEVIEQRSLAPMGLCKVKLKAFEQQTPGEPIAGQGPRCSSFALGACVAITLTLGLGAQPILDMLGIAF